MDEKIDIEKEYQRLLKKAATMPEGLYKAYTEMSHCLVGGMYMTRERSFRTFTDPVKAMKKAKRMAVWRDWATRGAEEGVMYGIEDVSENG